MISEEIIKKFVVKAFQDLFDYSPNTEDIKLQPTKKEFQGTHTFVVFPFLKFTKKKPEDSAQDIGTYLLDHCQEVSGFNVVKGFLNLSLKDESWVNAFKEIYQQNDFGVFPDNQKKVIVEYSSPNTNKPLHLGHLRNNFLGYSVSEILKANGYTVRKINLVNDRGIHICKSMLAYQKFGNGETPTSSGIKGDHLIGKYYVRFDQEYKKQIAELVQKKITEDQARKEAPIIREAQEMLKQWEENDTQVVALWKKMNEWVYEGFAQTYQRIGVDFDKYYYESDTYLLGKDIVSEGLSKGVFFKKEDGSVWADLSDEGLDEKLILRADGTSVYMTQDLGTAELKYQDFTFDQSVYVVGNEQDYHFDVLFKILKKLNKSYANGMYHLSYGMVDLPTGKMKSREGTVVDADDLVQEVVDTAEKTTQELGKIEGFSEAQAKTLYETIGLGALKYFLLKVDPKKRMLFDPQESVQFQGNTGPFIQYTHARIAAIVRKAATEKIDFQNDSFFNHIDEIDDTEREVIMILAQYPQKIQESGTSFDPSIVAQYVYDLAKEYNRFYAEVSIFKEANMDKLKFRIALSEKVAKTIKSAMELLGIDVPERM